MKSSYKKFFFRNYITVLQLNSEKYTEVDVFKHNIYGVLIL